VMALAVVAGVVTARRRRLVQQRAGTVPVEHELTTSAPEPDRRTTPGE
jgi:hypothetical protein